MGGGGGGAGEGARVAGCGEEFFDEDFEDFEGRGDDGVAVWVFRGVSELPFCGDLATALLGAPGGEDGLGREGWGR